MAQSALAMLANEEYQRKCMDEQIKRMHYEAENRWRFEMGYQPIPFMEAQTQKKPKATEQKPNKTLLLCEE